MKLSGSSKKGHHAGNGFNGGDNGDIREEIVAGDSESLGEPAKKKRKKLPIILGVVLGVLIVGGAYSYFFVRSSLDTPPPLREDRKSLNYITPVNPSVPLVPGQSAAKPGSLAETSREESKYTFLILAMDDGGGNTDVIMVATFDTVSHTMEIVNIPRDTLMNVSWRYKKVNTVYSTMRQQYGSEDSAIDTAMDATIEKIADLTGFMVDYWVIVDMEAFVALINAIDGVDFYVPVNMNYDDFQAGLSIHYNKGDYHLYGKDALQVMRYRSGYANQDIGRIGTQQSFLLSAAKQILDKRNSIDVAELARIFIKYVKTDMELGHLIWFGNEFLKLNAESINFHVLPGNYMEYIEQMWYVSVYVDEWLEIINEYISPYQEEIMPEDVSILTRDSNGYLYVTDGNRQGNASWGSARGQPYSPAADTGVNGAQASMAPAATGGGSMANPVDNTPRISTGEPVQPGESGEPVESGESGEPGEPGEAMPPDGSEPGEGQEPPEGSEGLPEGEPGDIEQPEESQPPEYGEESPPEEAAPPPAEPSEELPPAPEAPPPADPEE